MTPSTTVRTQNMVALERANVVRLHLARVRADLKAGRTTLADCVGDPYLANVAIDKLVLSLHRVSHARANLAFRAAHVNPKRRMNTVSHETIGRIEAGLDLTAANGHPR